MTTPTNPPTPEGWPWPIEPNGPATQNIRSTPDGRLIETRHELAADLEPDDLPGQLDDRAAERVGKSYSLIDAALMSDAAYTIRHLAALLDGVLADDPQAIRDAAQWLTVNRPEKEEG